MSSFHTINDLAASQHGHVAHRQLVSAGLTPRQIQRARERGNLLSVFRGIYRIPGMPDSWQGSLMATILYAGPGSAASHRSAARLHHILKVDPIIEVCTPRRRRARDLPEETIVHTSIILPRADLIAVGGLPCTTVERTLIDLGAVQSQRRVAHALDTALRGSKTDRSLLEYVHARRRGRGRRGAGVLARVLDQHALTGTSDSPYERDLVTALIETDVPLPRLQHEVRRVDGSLVARADLAWPQEKLIVEVDGHGFHSDRDQRASDSSRQNTLTSMGWTVLRFTTDQVHTGREDAVRQIAEFIRSCDARPPIW